MSVVTQRYFQTVEENNYMFQPFSGWAIIRLRLEYRRKSQPDNGPPRKRPKHVVFFNNLKIQLLRRTFTHFISNSSFIHSIAMCRMRRFLAVLSSFFQSSLLYTFPANLLHQPFFHPPSLHLAIYFLVYLSVLSFPNSYTILFWKFYFLPFYERVQTNVNWAKEV
jgi:hypothetical protein